ncbi:MAG: hypothetical protein WBL95_06795 [Microcoleus sp.]
MSINYKCVLVAWSEKVQNVWVIYVLDNTLCPMPYAQSPSVPH